MALSDHLAGWRPAPVEDNGVIASDPVAGLSAVLDQPQAVTDGDPLPPLWHWLQLLEWPRQSRLGADGHPEEGPFLPPIPDRRRMYAGGRVHVAEPLEVGAPVHRTSSLGDCVVKQGGSGELAFVTVHSVWSQHGRTRLTEEQDYVYRSGETGAREFTVPTDSPADSADPWRLVPDTSPVTLFRFSALTANAHRIHYDAPYATGTEGYPGLVVHGPLLVLLMMEALRRNDSRPVASVTFRLRRPVFSGMPIVARGGPSEDDSASLTVASAADERHATADVRFAQ